MKDEQQWVEEKYNFYLNSREETIEEILIDTMGVIGQFLDNKNSKAALSVLEKCFEYNNLFLERIERERITCKISGTIPE